MTDEFSTDVLSRIGSVQAQVPLTPRPWKQDLGFVVLGVLGAIGLVIGLGVRSESNGSDDALAAVFLVLGGLFLACGIALFLRRKARSGVVAVGEQGFAVRRGSRSRAVAYSEVDALVAFDKPLYSNGVPAGTEWRIEASGRGGKLGLRAWSAGHQNDPVEALYGYVLAKVADAWESRRRGGEGLAGKGWKLDGSGLQVPAAGTVGLHELRAADVYEGQVCLWRGSDSEPFLRTPVGSPNATLLLVLARRALPKDAKEDTSTLGRVLFRRSPGRWLAISMAVLAVGAGLGTALVAREEGEEAAAIGVGFLFVSLALVAATMLRRRFRCFERGVELRGLLGTRTLRFDELVGYDHSAVRMYHNGAYTGTNVSFTFHPDGGKALTYGTQFQGGDADFERLHTHITGLVANRLFDRISREGLEVAWGKHARLTREGLVFFGHKLIGKGPEVRLAWSEELRWTINQGQFTLFGVSQPGVELRMASSSRNFYPGLLLLQRLSEQAAARKIA